MTLRFLPALLATAAATLLAHHSVSAEFDKAKETTYKATVEKVQWINPHVLFTAKVADAKGSEVWTFELGSPNGLPKQGWTKNTLKEGDVLTIQAFPAKDGSHKGTVTRITWADGTTRENKDAWSTWMPLNMK
jgi:hypothetical protein